MPQVDVAAREVMAKIEDERHEHPLTPYIKPLADDLS
jgi:hypothetical protein